jgi:hypothetical protein
MSDTIVAELLAFMLCIQNVLEIPSWYARYFDCSLKVSENCTGRSSILAFTRYQILLER